MDVIVGTAGHIDHGKTALVRALTGTDTDRLPEEKQRGITIDLGFAELKHDDVGIGFVDVPGHERFVKNMLAGASGIDLVLLVVAADEGVMPQTREHFDICRLLKIKTGVIALTKTDMVDDETLELAALDAAELVRGSFLEAAPVFPVSSRSGRGIDELKLGLFEAARAIEREKQVHETRLAIDRSFSVKGFGAVVTGTLSSGEITEGDEVDLVPIGRRVRVRGVQSHGKSTTSAHAGQRTAVNLAGVDHEEITRGLVLTRPGTITVTQAFDAEVEVLPDARRAIRSRQRVRLHLGTTEVLARVSVLNEALAIETGSRGFVQLRLESPMAARFGDRFIIRSYSPQQTIGGGRILDPTASRHRRSNFPLASSNLSELSASAEGNGNIAEIFTRMSGARGVGPEQLRALTGLRADVLGDFVGAAETAGAIVNAAGVLISSPVFEKLKTDSMNAIESFHRGDKLARGMSRETLRERLFRHSDPDVFKAVTAALERERKIVADQDVFKLASHEAQLSPAEMLTRDRLRSIYSAAGLEAPKLEEALSQASSAGGLDARSARKVFQLLVNAGELVAVTQEFYFLASVLHDLTVKLRTGGDSTIDVARFKELAGVSRKYAIPLLEYFDRTRVTQRVGDVRRIL